ncbi:MAG: SRPBCC domain-containing protein [Alphaproteobacteria bacterium]|nr:SRPBCC domain-containing protein [Alphaproteobacteria bacterium]
MSRDNDDGGLDSGSLSLIVRRVVDGTPDAAFQAWTEPEQIKSWWGPANVTCTDCAIDLRVGGYYRIANELPDGTVIWIVGEFVRIEPPHLLEYSWATGSEPVYPEGVEQRVVVRFVATGSRTEVIVEHSNNPSQEVLDDHRVGWLGCLDGLEAFLSAD